MTMTDDRSQSIVDSDIAEVRHRSFPALFRRIFFSWKNRKRPPEGPTVLRVVHNNATLPENVPAKCHPHRGYACNRVRTTKYTLLSFVPKNLFEQFHRIANLYFIGVVLLNWMPRINAFGKEVAIIPVVFVLGVTAIKDWFEDYRRYKSDKRINNLTCRVYSRLTDTRDFFGLGEGRHPDRLRSGAEVRSSSSSRRELQDQKRSTFPS